MNAQMTDDLSSIKIDFGWNITVDGVKTPYNATTDLCNAII